MEPRQATKKEVLDALGKAIHVTLAEFVEEQGCSVETAVKVLAGRQDVRTAGEKSDWGRLPEDYDPSNDDSLKNLR